MKRHPNAFDYLTCYPEAVKLWRAGKFQEAANSFVHSPANLVLGNEEQKAAHYAKERQATVTNSATAKAHEAITDGMVDKLRATEADRASEEWKQLCREVNGRRDEWQKLFGVYGQHKKKRRNAIRLKNFVRTMTA